MTTEHPIVPPSYLIETWHIDWAQGKSMSELLIEAAQWGANEELKACSEWIKFSHADDITTESLRAARRPKPLSLRAALQELVEELSDINQYTPPGVSRAIENARCALEKFND